MNFEAYCALFENILATPTETQTAPYNSPAYLDYTKLNWHRMQRWLKTGKLSDKLASLVQQINTPQQWIMITEPWCGDAAHSIPFIKMMSDLNPLISLSFELRDQEPFSINNHLTDGRKSIPVLLFNDSVKWGPRPAECQILYRELLRSEASFEKIKLDLQNWYNTNKGVALQAELAVIIGKQILYTDQVE